MPIKLLEHTSRHAGLLQELPLVRVRARLPLRQTRSQVPVLLLALRVRKGQDHRRLGRMRVPRGLLLERDPVPHRLRQDRRGCRAQRPGQDRPLRLQLPVRVEAAVVQVRLQPLCRGRDAAVGPLHHGGCVVPADCVNGCVCSLQAQSQEGG